MDRNIEAIVFIVETSNLISEALKFRIGIAILLLFKNQNFRR